MDGHDEGPNGFASVKGLDLGEGGEAGELVGGHAASEMVAREVEPNELVEAAELEDGCGGAQ